MAKPLAVVNTSDKGDDATREIEGKALIVDNDLRRIGAIDGFHVAETLAKGGNLGGRIVETLAQRTKLRGMDEGFVALHVDHDIGRSPRLLDSLLQTVGTTSMVGRSHDGLAPESFNGLKDAVVVGSHADLVEDRRHLLVDSLDDGFTAKHGKGLARETRRRIARRNDSCEFHKVLFRFNVSHRELRKPSRSTYLRRIMRW